MDGLYHRQTQFELFPSEGGSPVEKSRPRLFNVPLTFSLENLIILTVVIVVSMVLSFSFGVERGKKDEVPGPALAPGTTAGEPRASWSATPAEVRGPARTPVAEVVAQDTPPVTEGPGQKAVPEPDGATSLLSANSEKGAPEKVVDKFYTVQVASYKKGDFAQKAALGLKQKGYDTMVMTKGSHEIVCVGKFAAMEQAKKFSEKLKKQYKDCLVRRM